jgi:RNA polymerase sigma-70 factor (ECF subfamily)
MTDRNKLETLFRQHYRQMYRLATILLHDDAESKDVVHDIFAQFLNDSRHLR